MTDHFHNIRRKKMSSSFADIDIIDRMMSADPDEEFHQICMCIRQGDVGKARRLYRCANMNQQLSIWDRRPPLHLAIQQENIDMIRFLLDECNANPNMTDDKGRTSLHMAVLQGNEDILKVLIDHGRIDFKAFDKWGQTALHLASLCSSVSAAKLLLDHCIECLHIRQRDGITPLQAATMAGNKQIVALFCAALDSASELNEGYRHALSEMNDTCVSDLPTPPSLHSPFVSNDADRSESPEPSVQPVADVAFSTDKHPPVKECQELDKPEASTSAEREQDHELTAAPESSAGANSSTEPHLSQTPVCPSADVHCSENGERCEQLKADDISSIEKPPFVMESGHASKDQLEVPCSKETAGELMPDSAHVSSTDPCHSQISPDAPKHSNESENHDRLLQPKTNVDSSEPDFQSESNGLCSKHKDLPFETTDDSSAHDGPEVVDKLEDEIPVSSNGASISTESHHSTGQSHQALHFASVDISVSQNKNGDNSFVSYASCTEYELSLPVDDPENTSSIDKSEEITRTTAVAVSCVETISGYSQENNCSRERLNVRQQDSSHNAGHDFAASEFDPASYSNISHPTTSEDGLSANADLADPSKAKQAVNLQVPAAINTVSSSEANPSTESYNDQINTCDPEAVEGCQQNSSLNNAKISFDLNRQQAAPVNGHQPEASTINQMPSAETKQSTSFNPGSLSSISNGHHDSSRYNLARSLQKNPTLVQQQDGMMPTPIVAAQPTPSIRLPVEVLTSQQDGQFDQQSKRFALSRTLLKLIAVMSESSEITVAQKGSLKDLVLSQNPAIMAAADLFAVDGDLDEFKDTLLRFCR